MSNERNAIIKLIAITVVIFFLISISTGAGTSDIHIHDTFFVLTAATRLIVFVICSVFVASLIVAVLCRFRNKLYVKILIFSAFLLFCSGIYLFSAFVKP